MGLSDLKSKLQEVNNNQRPAHIFYFYKDLTYCMIYEIIGPYKNNPDIPKIKTHKGFNKTVL